jgi:hypothetical protein
VILAKLPSVSSANISVKNDGQLNRHGDMKIETWLSIRWTDGFREFARGGIGILTGPK